MGVDGGVWHAVSGVWGACKELNLSLLETASVVSIGTMELGIF